MKKSFTIPKLRRCGHCEFFLTVKPPKVRNPESKDYGGWCSINELTTAPGLLRCGGDDFERKAR